MSLAFRFLILGVAQVMLLSMGAAEAAPGMGARWERPNGANVEWSDFAFNEIRRQGDVLTQSAPQDINEFCPIYPSLRDDEKREFWVYFISTIAELESSHRPALFYQESFRDSSGQLVVSRGLLQMSLQSANAYGCGFKTSADLHDPFQNLSCGIKILSRWIGRDGRITGQGSKGWMGGGRYWSVLRTEKKLSQIQGWTNSYCLKRSQ
ncbi:MAG: transglycosylase SLT domain-containing protein [Bdellovibrionales bacterium]|nr:transglycosylase SLT domain-containing protein [Bdellovibrionales bacterium]